MLSNFDFFKNSPEKILGVPFSKSSRYGQVVTSYKETTNGFKADLQKVLDTLPNCSTSKGLTISQANIIANPMLPSVTELKNAEKAIQKSSQERKDKKRQNAAKQEYDVLTFDEVDEMCNSHLTTEQKQAFVYWQMHTLGRKMAGGWTKYHLPVNSPKLKKIIENGYMFAAKKGFLPTFILLSGDLYENQENIEKNANFVVDFYQKIGFSETEAQKHKEKSLELLADKIAVGLSNKLRFIANYETNGALKLSANNQLSRTTKYEDKPLIQMFADWVRSNSSLIRASSYQDIIRLGILNERRKRDDDEAEFKNRKSKATDEAERLFSIYMADFAPTELRELIENTIHKKYNSQVEPDLKQVPIGFPVATHYNGNVMQIKAEKREAVAKAMLTGSLCVAYGVGLGKTWCAAFTMAQFIENGWAERPLLVVPLQVYKQFYRELSGLLPHIPVIEWRNLSGDYGKKAMEIKIQAGSICVCTHEGFMKIGFSNAEYDSLVDSFLDVLFVSDTDKSKTEEAKEAKKAEAKLGASLRGATIQLDKMGIDFICIDEAHAAKKIFTNVTVEKNEGDIYESQTKKYNLSAGEPSQMGLRTFIVCQYIQSQSKTSNVLLLTATPFTNSPFEIYSFLMLLGYKYLRNKNLVSLYNFFDYFAEIKNELVVNAALQVEMKPVFTGFKQLTLLQKLIQKFFIYKTKTDDVIRPNKWVFPMKNIQIGNGNISSKSVSSIVAPTTYQRDGITFAKKAVFAAKQQMGQFNFNKMKAEMMKAMTKLRLISLSPYLIEKDKSLYEFLDLPPLNYKSYIDTSSKLQYVMGCVRSVREYSIQNNMPIGGQIIYMNVGVEFFPLIKEYLVKEVGYNETEIAFITGSMQPNEGTKNQIQDKFQGRHFNSISQEFEPIPDEFRVKVLIGSQSITEGLNLQDHCVAIYNCYLEWNPTDAIQLEGRGWRRGNLHKNIRIVYPLVQDSMDTFIFQKIEEKTKRINAIWNFTGSESAVDLSDFSPSELKYSLISDPQILVSLEQQEQEEKININISLLKGEQKRAEKVLSDFKTMLGQSDCLDAEDYATNLDISQSLRNLPRNLEDKIMAEIAEIHKASYESVFEKYKAVHTYLLQLKRLVNKNIELTNEYSYWVRYQKDRTDTPEPTKPEYTITLYNFQFPFVWQTIQSKQTREIKKEIEELQNYFTQVLEPLLYDTLNSISLQSFIDGKEQKIQDFTTQLNDLKGGSWKAQRMEEIRLEQAAQNSVNVPVEARLEEFAEYNFLLNDKFPQPFLCNWGAGQIVKAKPGEKHKLQIDIDGETKMVEVLKTFPRTNCEPMYLVKYANGYLSFALESKLLTAGDPRAKKTPKKILEFLTLAYNLCLQIDPILGQTMLNVIEDSYTNEGTNKTYVPKIARNNGDFIATLVSIKAANNSISQKYGDEFYNDLKEIAYKADEIIENGKKQKNGRRILMIALDDYITKGIADKYVFWDRDYTEAITGEFAQILTAEKITK
jgi:Type III restriction enzyme, res subunit/Helicase conserved C-terminal domain